MTSCSLEYMRYPSSEAGLRTRLWGVDWHLSKIVIEEILVPEVILYMRRKQAAWSCTLDLSRSFLAECLVVNNFILHVQSWLISMGLYTMEKIVLSFELSSIVANVSLPRKTNCWDVYCFLYKATDNPLVSTVGRTWLCDARCSFIGISRWKKCPYRWSTCRLQPVVVRRRWSRLWKRFLTQQIALHFWLHDTTFTVA